MIQIFLQSRKKSVCICQIRLICVQIFHIEDVSTTLRLFNDKIIFMDLRTTYMGLNLKSPIVVSACTLSEEVGNIVQMEDSGAGAVVLFSLFEEQLKKEEAKYEKNLR